MTGKPYEDGAFTAEDISTLSAADGVKATPLFKLDAVKYDYYRVYVMLNADSAADVTVTFGDSEKDESGAITSIPAVDGEFTYTLSGADLLIDTWYSITVKTPKGADAFRVMGPSDAEYRIYGMNE